MSVTKILSYTNRSRNREETQHIGIMWKFKISDQITDKCYACSDISSRHGKSRLVNFIGDKYN